MPPPPRTDLAWLTEYHALCRAYADAQHHCTELIRGQQRRIAALESQLMLLQGELIRRDTALAWAQADQAVLAAGKTPATPEADPAALASSLRAADLVICQTGCVSHGAYWRVEDYCRRTGKPCVLVDQPEALRIVRLHRPPRAESMAASFTPERDDPAA
ncbi:DUF2325 domain-containing protein [Thiomonas intermedia]|uniref:DUF2325 domain-containing protein n=1 Tax=Thiomonas intermedia TaxID=926 RepID=UPI0009A50F3E|nr:DUF2325 domain-containing protein [Thiomonas intermedia]